MHFKLEYEFYDGYVYNILYIYDEWGAVSFLVVRAEARTVVRAEACFCADIFSSKGHDDADFLSLSLEEREREKL